MRRLMERVFNQNCFTIFESAVSGAESLPCCLSEQLVKCLLCLVHSSFSEAGQSMSFKGETKVYLFASEYGFFFFVRCQREGLELTQCLAV